MIYKDAGCDSDLSSADANADAKAKFCISAKAGLDAAKNSGFQIAIDLAKQTCSDAGCGAEALYGSIAAVAFAIYATTFWGWIASERSLTFDLLICPPAAIYSFFLI